MILISIRLLLCFLIIVNLYLATTELYKHDIIFLYHFSSACFLLTLLKMFVDWNEIESLRDFFTQKVMTSSLIETIFNSVGIGLLGIYLYFTLMK